MPKSKHQVSSLKSSASQHCAGRGDSNSRQSLRWWRRFRDVRPRLPHVYPCAGRAEQYPYRDAPSFVVTVARPGVETQTARERRLTCVLDEDLWRKALRQL